MTVLIRRVPHLPAVQVRLAAIGGLWCESPANNGVFSTLGELMCAGTERLRPAAFTEACAGIGLAPRAEAHPNHLSLTASCLPEDAARAVELLAFMWTAPRINAASMPVAIAAVNARLRAQPTNTAAFADFILRAALFDRQPYQLNLIGAADALQRLTPQDAAQIHQDFITPRNSVLVISGDVDESAMEHAAREAFARFKEREKSDDFIRRGSQFVLNPQPPRLIVRVPDEPPLTAVVTRVFSSARADALVICGLPAPGCDASNYPPELVQIVRGALLAAAEQLQQEWHDYLDADIISAAGCSAASAFNAGWISVYLAVPGQFAREALLRLQAVTRITLQRLASDAALARARQRAEWEFAYAMLDEARVDDRLAQRELFGYAARSPQSFSASLRQCTPQALARFLEDYGKHPVTALVTPEQ